MKKRLCSILLTCIFIMTLAAPVFAAIDTSDLDKEIAALESEITKLQEEKNTLGQNGNVIMGNVISTNPYIISGSGVGDDSTRALLAGIKYFVVNNPEDGELRAGYFYSGTHKYVGTTTIVINKVKYTAYVFDKFQNLERWRSLGDIIKEKESRLNELKSQKEEYSKDLGSFSTDNYNQIILQIGNPEMYSPGGKLSRIDASSKDAYPTIINGSTMVPLRAIVEAYGGSVAWDNASQKVTLALGKNVVELIVDSTTALVNGKNIAMTTPAQIINSKLMVPVRFVSENLGMNIEWLEKAKVIRISYGKDRIESNLKSTDDGYFVYTDDVMGAQFTYPQEFGKPEVSREINYYLTLITEKNGVESKIEITYVGGEEGRLYKYYNRGDIILPLSDTNSGIEMIKQFSYSYKLNEVTIFGKNESVIIIKWDTYIGHSVSEAEYPDRELELAKDRMKEIITKIVSAFTMREAMG